MPNYETVFIVRQDMSPTQVEGLADSYAEVLGEYGGSVEKREMWGLRTLAYRMNKNRKGHYVMLHCNTPAAGLSEMERQMRLREDVLRYMSVRIEEVPEGPSPMLQQRERGDGERGERGERGPRERRDRDQDGQSRRDNAAETAPTETAAAAEPAAEAAPAEGA